MTTRDAEWWRDQPCKYFIVFLFIQAGSVRTPSNLLEQMEVGMCLYSVSPIVACCFVYHLANKNHCWRFWGLSLLNWGHALPKGTFLIMAEWQHVLFTFSALAFSTSSEMQHILYSLCLQNCLKNFTPVLP